jgi:hypothetical protein
MFVNWISRTAAVDCCAIRTGTPVIRDRLYTAILSAAGLLGVGCCACATAQADDAAMLDPAQVEFFESKIRPVLIEHCYACHAAEGEGEGIKGGLRLDFAAGWQTGGDSGPAIIPGNPAESLLLQALKYESYEMPPAGQLPETVIADFEAWIQMGAADPRSEAPSDGLGPRVVDLEAGRQFWSFRPVVRPTPPAVQNSAWVRTSIDRFLLAALETVQLTPSPDTDPSRLLRRLHYDLVGAPPTASELVAFQQAWESDPERTLAATVDRLIESPGFGEHWGRHWLDVARYADSNGGDFNATFHDAWRYRDYVIASINRDKPFQEFVREQIAGDLLPYDSEAQREEQLVATGFLMLGTKMLSERDKEKLRMDVIDEQLNSLGQAFLGLTLGCARCHDHKFDPIPARDYYALAGIFGSSAVLEGEIQQYVSNWGRQPLPIEPEHAAALAAHKARTDELGQQLAEAKKLLEQATQEQSSTRGLGIMVDDVEAMKVGEWKPSTHVNRYIGAGYLHDDKRGKGEWSITFTPNLPAAGEYEVRFAYASASGRDAAVPVHVHHAGGETVVPVDQRPDPPIEQLFQPLGRFQFEAGTAGRVTVSTEGTTDHVIVDAMQFIPVSELDAAPTAEADAAASMRITELEAQVKQIEELQKAHAANAPPPAPQALAIRESSQVADACVCIRGEHNRHGDQVPRGFLQVALFEPAAEIPADASGRLQLANWIADPRHPLTARVFVNRVWAHLFGEGLVRTVDNFGMLGDRPSHPELLDHLAVEFIDHNGSLKSLVREIVLSRAYRQQAIHREEAFLVDPENRLLWRANRKRLPAEALRDSLLAISGGLDESRGGSMVANLGTLVDDNQADSKGYEGADAPRRSVYMPIIRNELPSMLAVFDFADPDFVTGRRAETNVPAQALLLMNSEFVRTSADATAKRLLETASGDDVGRVQSVYRTILARDPDAAELDRALEFVESLRSSHAGAVATGDGSGETPDEAERAPWTRLIHVLFASTDFRLLD